MLQKNTISNHKSNHSNRIKMLSELVCEYEWEGHSIYCMTHHDEGATV